MASSQNDFEIRKVVTWSAIHICTYKIKSIWNSKMKNSLKISYFKATIEPILLYGSEFWTLDSTVRNTMYGCYTWLLRITTTWKYKVTNIQIYEGMSKISEVIKQRRLRLAGHYIRHTDEIAHNLIVWRPNNGIRNRGRRYKTFINILKNDCDYEDV